MARDYREAAYTWEGQWKHWNLKMFDSLYGPRHWVRWACRKYGTKPPAVHPLPAKGELTYYGSLTHTIHLQPQHWNISTVLHEAAHCILFRKTGERFEDHGKEWLGVYTWLLIQSKHWPTIALSSSAKAAGLPWHPLSPTALKKLAWHS